jgi:2-polyprenyl-3-methyl-5-hydroxy-6-metoxy-1,4-benzoquinol methylase
LTGSWITPERPGDLAAQHRLATGTARALGQLRDIGGRSARIDALVRSDRLEFLDRDDVPAWGKRLGMRMLARFNQVAGSNKVFRSEIERALGPMSEAHIYDLAAGTGGFGLWLDASPPAEITLRVTSSDLEPEYVDIGRTWAAAANAGVRFEVRDALDLADAGDVDLFLCIQASHHLGAARIVRMVHGAIHQASRGILIIDAYRSAGVALAVGAASCALMPMPMFMHDAMLSVRRSFTPAELALLAHLAGAGEVEAAAVGPAFCMLHAMREAAQKTPC